MSKFIKVTNNPTGSVIFQNINQVDCFQDNLMVCIDGSSMDIKETIEQIEAQLLRDEFAKHALSGFSADREMPTEGTIRLSYEYADAMLKERLK